MNLLTTAVFIIIPIYEYWWNAAVSSASLFAPSIWNSSEPVFRFAIWTPKMEVASLIWTATSDFSQFKNSRSARSWIIASVLRSFTDLSAVRKRRPSPRAYRSIELFRKYPAWYTGRWRSLLRDKGLPGMGCVWVLASGTKGLHTRGLWFMIYRREINASRHNIPPNGGRVHSTRTTRERKISQVCNFSQSFFFTTIIIGGARAVNDPSLFFMLCFRTHCCRATNRLHFRERRGKREGEFMPPSSSMKKKSRVPSQRGVSHVVSLCVLPAVSLTRWKLP